MSAVSKPVISTTVPKLTMVKKDQMSIDHKLKETVVSLRNIPIFSDIWRPGPNRHFCLRRIRRWSLAGDAWSWRNALELEASLNFSFVLFPLCFTRTMGNLTSLLWLSGLMLTAILPWQGGLCNHIPKLTLTSVNCLGGSIVIATEKSQIQTPVYGTKGK